MAPELSLPAATEAARPTESDLRLETTRMRLHEIMILRMKTWLPAETLRGLRMPKHSGGSRSGCIFESWSAFAKSRAGPVRTRSCTD
jgi:hypothetical protein